MPDNNSENFPAPHAANPAIPRVIPANLEEDIMPAADPFIVSDAELMAVNVIGVMSNPNPRPPAIRCIVIEGSAIFSSHVDIAISDIVQSNMPGIATNLTSWVRHMKLPRTAPIGMAMVSRPSINPPSNGDPCNTVLAINGIVTNVIINAAPYRRCTKFAATKPRFLNSEIGMMEYGFFNAYIAYIKNNPMPNTDSIIIVNIDWPICVNAKVTIQNPETTRIEPK